MKLIQFIAYNNRNIFFKSYVENEVGKQVPYLFFQKNA